GARHAERGDAVGPGTGRSRDSLRWTGDAALDRQRADQLLGDAPFHRHAAGQSFQPDTATLQLSAGAPGPAPSGEQLQLELTIPRTTVYLHERVPFTVTLRVGEVRVSDVQYPRVPGDGFTVEPLTEPTQRQERRDGGAFQGGGFQGR